MNSNLSMMLDRSEEGAKVCCQGVLPFFFRKASCATAPPAVCVAIRIRPGYFEDNRSALQFHPLSRIRDSKSAEP